MSPRRYYAEIGDTLSGFADFLEKRNVEGRARREREGERAARAAEREAVRKENLRRHEEEVEWRKARQAFELGEVAGTGEAGARRALEGARLFGIEPPPGTTEVTPPTFAPGAPPSVGQLSGPELGAGPLPLAPGRPSYEYEDIPQAHLPVEPPPPQAPPSSVLRRGDYTWPLRAPEGATPPPPPPMPVPQQAPTAPFGEAALQGLAPRGLGAAPAVRPLPGDLRQPPGTEYGEFGSLPPAPDPTVGGDYLTALLGETPPDPGFRMEPTQYPTSAWTAAGRAADVEGRVKKEEALIETVLDGISTTSRSKGTGGVAMEIDEFRLSQKRPTREDVKRWQDALAKERKAENAAKLHRARAMATTRGAVAKSGRLPEGYAKRAKPAVVAGDIAGHRAAYKAVHPGATDEDADARYEMEREVLAENAIAKAERRKADKKLQLAAAELKAKQKEIDQALIPEVREKLDLEAGKIRRRIENLLKKTSLPGVPDRYKPTAKKNLGALMDDPGGRELLQRLGNEETRDGAISFVESIAKADPKQKATTMYKTLRSIAQMSPEDRRTTLLDYGIALDDPPAPASGVAKILPYSKDRRAARPVDRPDATVWGKAGDGWRWMTPDEARYEKALREGTTPPPLGQSLGQ
jgi:hypothetical protein